jgi:hypothetical protein
LIWMPESVAYRVRALRCDAKYWVRNGVIEGVFRGYNREGHPLF